MRGIGAVAAVLSIAMSAPAFSQENKYKISFVEITSVDKDHVTARFVEKAVGFKEVLTLLKSKDKEMRFSVIRSVEEPDTWAEGDRTQFVLAMGQCLPDEYLAVRFRACQALGLVGPDAAAVLPALIKATEDEELFVKVFAIKAIGNIGPHAKTAIPVLAKLLEADDKFVRMNAGSALARIGPEAVPALIEALKSKKNEARLEAAEDLGSMGTDAKSAIPALKELSIDMDKSLSLWARRAIEEIGQPSRLRPPYIYGKRNKEDTKKQEGQQ